MSTRLPRVRAPELTGRGWLNTGGATLRLADLRGRFVLLHFWTFCCVNCLHVLDELRPLQNKYGDTLVTIGVHSPKFEHEADPDAVAAAVQRHEVAHPVLDDPELATWGAYAARAWPTLVLVDPEGYVVAHFAGEGHAHALDALLGELVAEHEAAGTLRRADSPHAPPEPEPGVLRFPASAARLPDGGLLIADAGHHRLVELDPDAETPRRHIGTGARGHADGGPAEAAFAEPNGLTLLPRAVAAAAGYDVVVADTGNHRLRGVRLSDGSVTTLAGSGQQWRPGDGTDRLSSPWDVAWWHDRLWVAMAGIHQLWTYDPRTGEVRVAAGTTHEGLVDGPVDGAWFAQPSRLAADGDRLWVVDAETSALRHVSGCEVGTVVGTGLFDFGFVDGPLDGARLQHPLGVTLLPDGSVALCDTYNGAVRRYDPAGGRLTTVATGLAEPSAAVLDGAYLLVVESAAHRLTRVPLGATAEAGGRSHDVRRPVTEVATGTLELAVLFDPPPGQHVDERFGPGSQVFVEATPPQLVRDGGGRGTGLVRTLILDPNVGDGVLHVAARAASCDLDDGPGAACHVHQQDWGVPVRIAPGGVRRLTLTLSARSGE